jgi:hypothetical protein
MNGATVTAISGTTITLSQRPYSFSRDGTYDRVSGPDWINLADTSSIVVGMRIFGSFGINTTVSEVVTNTRVRLTASPSPVPAEGAQVTVYFMVASPAASSYTFTADLTYVFRDFNAALPFGSFPGIGAFSA